MWTHRDDGECLKVKRFVESFARLVLLVIQGSNWASAKLNTNMGMIYKSQCHDFIVQFACFQVLPQGFPGMTVKLKSFKCPFPSPNLLMVA